MNPSTDTATFKKILARNVTLPLVLAAMLSAIFISVILHIVSINHAVLHSNQVIGRSWSTLQTIVDFETGLRGYLVTGKENFLEPYYHSEETFRPKMADFFGAISDNPAQVDRLKAVQTSFNEWQKYAEELIELRKSGGKYYDIVISERGKKMMDGMRVQIAEIIQAEETLRDERTKNSEETVRDTLLIVILLGLLVGAIMALSSRRQLVILSKEYESTLEKQLEQNRVLRYQEWLQTGQANLAYEIRGEQSVEALAQKILNFLAHYLEVGAATLYVADEAGMLRRSAAFAISGDELSRNETVKVGQSLVGQAAA
jgi:CHASE3 domain sensor protein